RASAHQSRYPLAPAERATDGAARGACGMGRRERARHAHLRDADATYHAHHYRRSHRNAGSGSAGDRARRWWRLRAENVAGGGIRGRDLGRGQAQDVGGVGRGPARESVACFHSRDQSIALEGAFDADAKVIGFAADILADVGAYSCYPTTCGVEPLMAMAELPGPYDVREYSCVARGVLTNTCPMAPYRGVSRPVITFALERLMD